MPLPLLCREIIKVENLRFSPFYYIFYLLSPFPPSPYPCTALGRQPTISPQNPFVGSRSENFGDSARFHPRSRLLHRRLKNEQTPSKFFSMNNRQISVILPVFDPRSVLTSSRRTSKLPQNFSRLCSTPSGRDKRFLLKICSPTAET